MVTTYVLNYNIILDLILSKLDYADLVFTLYHNSYFAVCNGLNLLLQVLYSVTMLRTFGMYLKSDGFQSIREAI